MPKPSKQRQEESFWKHFFSSKLGDTAQYKTRPERRDKDFLFDVTDNLSYVTVIYPVKEVCNFLGSVSSQQKFEVTDGAAVQPPNGSVLQLHATVQFYLESKGKYILEAWRPADPKDQERREAPPPNFGSSFYMFFSPTPGPALCKLA